MDVYMNIFMCVKVNIIYTYMKLYIYVYIFHISI